MHNRSRLAKTQLGDICSFASGTGFKEALQGNRAGAYPFIKVSDLNLEENQKWIKTSNNWIDEAARKELRAVLHPANSVVFAKVGAALKLNKRRLLARPTAIDNNLMAAVPNENRVLPEYLYYFLQTKDLGRLCQDGAVPSVNQTHLSAIPIDLPNLVEQARVVDVLRVWDGAIDKMALLVRAKEKCVRGMLSDCVSDARGTVGRDGWKKTTLGEVARIVSRRVVWDEQATYRRITVKRGCGGLVFREDRKGHEILTKDMYTVHAGDFVISKRQVVHGAWAMALPEFDGAHVSKEYACLEAKPDQLWMPYLDWLSRTDRLRHEALICSYGVDIEKMVLNVDWLLQTPLLLPRSIDAQKAMVAALDSLQREVNLLCRQLEALRRQRRGLRQLLFATGREEIVLDGQAGEAATRVTEEAAQ